MPSFGATSKERLSTCDQRLQELMNDVISHVDPSMDFKILCGHRGEADQKKACELGNSKTPWPTSCHNSLPSRAVDICPVPVDWSNIKAFQKLGALVKQRAAALGIKIRWGGDFKSFKDYPHFELLGE